MTDPKPQITVEALVQASPARTWACWTEPQHIMEWNAASDDWHCPSATSDLRVGGEFHSTMAARDGSFQFDFGGTFEEIIPQQKIVSVMGDGRKIVTTFEETPDGVRVTETFEAESENPLEMQRAGWQAILDRFKKHVEGEGGPPKA